MSFTIPQGREWMNNLIGGRFIISQHIGGGTFGDVFIGFDTIQKKNVAIKVGKEDVNSNKIATEKLVYEKVFWEKGFPRLFFYIIEPRQQLLITELLGDSLQFIMNKYRHFSLKTTLMIAVQLISRIESLHRHGFIHRDLKPDNFLIGRDNLRNTIHLIDFGLSCPYIDVQTNSHISFIQNLGKIGNCKFCSIQSHLGNSQSRRDDLESIAYILVYFLTGTLPWNSVPTSNKEEKYQFVASKKMTMSPRDICCGCPIEFAQFLTIARSLKFDENPDYQSYITMFQQLFISEGYKDDGIFDWMESNQHELAMSQVQQIRRRIINPKSYLVQKRKYLRSVRSGSQINNNQAIVSQQQLPRFGDSLPRSPPRSLPPVNPQKLFQ